MAKKEEVKAEELGGGFRANQCGEEAPAEPKDQVAEEKE
ncbi:hypothetical protein UFOVP423_16 [uncultured Caudovirales phage]|uniref:Uncharacterized protein n=1 Tax=uncultured Caudovirales phage TaxID=2100421 RepID=A0A6J5M7B0_9CAUD|nr:hypothetical protein UFOVP423_16 [uncultured Caudovirales phage]